MVLQDLTRDKRACNILEKACTNITFGGHGLEVLQDLVWLGPAVSFQKLSLEKWLRAMSKSDRLTYKR